MKVTFSLLGKDYTVREVTIEDHYAMQTELAINDRPGFFIVNLLSGCPIDLLKQLPIPEWEELWTAVQAYLIDQNSKKSIFKPRIVLDDVDYSIVNLNNLSIGEFADLDLILNSPDYERRVHEAMAVLYRPFTIDKKTNKMVIEEYDGDVTKERSNKFKKLLLSDAKRAIGFFLDTAIQSIEVTLSSLEITEEMKKAVPEIEETVLNMRLNLQDLGTLLLSRYQIQIP
jgi:hypothetical protein